MAEDLDYFVIEPCNTAGGFEITLKGKKIDLKTAAKLLENAGEIIGSTPVVLVLKIDGRKVSIYSSGRMMMNERTLRQKDAEKLAKKILSLIKESVM